MQAYGKRSSRWRAQAPRCTPYLPDSTRFAAATEDKPQSSVAKPAPSQTLSREHVALPVTRDDSILRASGPSQLMATNPQYLDYPPILSPTTSLAWSNNGGQFFIAFDDKKIISFDASTESQILNDDVDVKCIAPVANWTFIAASASCFFGCIDPHSDSPCRSG